MADTPNNGFDKQSVEGHKPGLLRKAIEPILHSKVSMEDLLQQPKPFPVDRNTTVQANYQGTQLAGFTRKTTQVIPKTLLHKAHDADHRENFHVKETFYANERTSERQTITPVNIPDGGTYTIKFDGKTTGPIAFNATAANINTALAAAGLGDLLAAGSLLTSITIQFNGTYANKQQPLLVINTAGLTIGARPGITPPSIKDTMIQQQIITPAATPIGGTYTIRFDGKTTAPLAFNASTTEINAALNAAGLRNMIATGNMLTTIAIEFTGVYQNTHQVPVVINATSLVAAKPKIAAPTIDDATIQQQVIKPTAIPDNGTYTILFGGISTADIPFNASRDDINAALMTAGLGDLTVSGDLTTAITVRFGGVYAGKHQVPVRIDAGGLSSAGTPIQAPTRDIIVQQKQTITPVNIPDNGTYTIRFDGKTTAPINFDASGSDISVALTAAGLGDLKVNGDLTTTTGITIEFTGAYADKHQMPIGIDVSQLTHGAAPAVNPGVVDTMVLQKQIITPTIIPDNGTYTINFNGISTPAIVFNANATDINTILTAAGLGDLKITGNMLSTMTIEFTGTYAGAHQPLISIDSSALTKGGSASIKPPTIKKVDTPRDNYCIAQEQGGQRFCVLLREDRTTKGTRRPVLNQYFASNYRGIPGGIAYQETNTRPVISVDNLRQKI